MIHPISQLHLAPVYILSPPAAPKHISSFPGLSQVAPYGTILCTIHLISQAAPLRHNISRPPSPSCPGKLHYFRGEWVAPCGVMHRIPSSPPHASSFPGCVRMHPALLYIWSPSCALHHSTTDPSLLPAACLIISGVGSVCTLRHYASNAPLNCTPHASSCPG